jgi:hypothetical protein
LYSRVQAYAFYGKYYINTEGTILFFLSEMLKNNTSLNMKNLLHTTFLKADNLQHCMIFEFCPYGHLRFCFCYVL